MAGHFQNTGLVIGAESSHGVRDCVCDRRAQPIACAFVRCLEDFGCTDTLNLMMEVRSLDRILPSG